MITGDAMFDNSREVLERDRRELEEERKKINDKILLIERALDVAPHKLLPGVYLGTFIQAPSIRHPTVIPRILVVDATTCDVMDLEGYCASKGMETNLVLNSYKVLGKIECSDFDEELFRD